MNLLPTETDCKRFPPRRGERIRLFFDKGNRFRLFKDDFSVAERNFMGVSVVIDREYVQVFFSLGKRTSLQGILPANRDYLEADDWFKDAVYVPLVKSEGCLTSVASPTPKESEYGESRYNTQGIFPIDHFLPPVDLA
jgi:hypothetical protein